MTWCLLVTAAGEQRLYLERVELDALHVAAVLQSGRHRLATHVPQQHALVGRTAGQQVPAITKCPIPIKIQWNSNYKS